MERLALDIVKLQLGCKRFQRSGNFMGLKCFVMQFSLPLDQDIMDASKLDLHWLKITRLLLWAKSHLTNSSVYQLWFLQSFSWVGVRWGRKGISCQKKATKVNESENQAVNKTRSFLSLLYSHSLPSLWSDGLGNISLKNYIPTI